MDPSPSTQLDQTFGALGWSCTLERCKTEVRTIETPGGPRHVAFTSATVSLLVGPAHAPHLIRQATGHHESAPQSTASTAVTQAEERAFERAFERCARTLLSAQAQLAPPPLPANDGLRACLEALDLGPALARYLADCPGERVVSGGLANQLWRTARLLFGRERANALWRELGLAPGQLPRGTQAQLYATHLNTRAHEATS